MNLDEHLLNHQNHLDSRESNDNKIYLVIYNGKIWAHGSDEKILREIFEERIEIVNTSENDRAELAWVWENDFNPRNEEQTIKYSETIALVQ